jgi:hypothetical protein
MSIGQYQSADELRSSSKRSASAAYGRRPSEDRKGSRLNAGERCRCARGAPQLRERALDVARIGCIPYDDAERTNEPPDRFG